MEIESLTMNEFSYYLFGVMGLIGFLLIAFLLYKYGGEYKFNSYKFEFYLLLLLPIFYMYIAVLMVIVFMYNTDFVISIALMLYWSVILAIPPYLFFVLIMVLIRFIRIKFIGK